MSGIRYNSFGISDTGKRKVENQDALFIDSENGIYVLADGISGSYQGGKAAQYVVDNAPRIFSSRVISDARSEDICSVLSETICELNQELRLSLGEHTGSTMVMVVILDGVAHIAHLGDSRAYYHNDEGLVRLTEDHNVAGHLVSKGVIGQEEAERHPSRHILTNYLGMEGPVEPDTRMLDMGNAGRLILCTDGLTGMISEREIEDVLSNEKDCKTVIQTLVDKANTAGGFDNITIILIDGQEIQV